ncbi:hypothetical protein Bca4012_034271 [Brassica carinata]
MPSLENSVTVISTNKVFPDKKSTLAELKLSVSDLPMLSCHYIQKGCLFTRPHLTPQELLSHLEHSLSLTLSHFPPLAGRLSTSEDGHVFLSCNDAGADIVFAEAKSVRVSDVITGVDVPGVVKEFFSYDRAVSYEGHNRPILAVQVTELNDGVFIGCSVNHAVVDGTSLWNFVNTFAEVSRGAENATRQPDFTRENVLISPAVLKVPRARNLPSTKTTTFRMAVNVRHRLSPKLNPEYFGNAIQSVPTFATAGEVLSRDIRWTADQLNQSVAAHGDERIREVVAEWEENPRCFPLGNADGASVTMGSSPRFPMYENDFGWGKPVAVRSGRANKFDGKISAFPGRDGNGSVDLEVILAPETMAGIECDGEFMRYVSKV